MRLRRSVSCVSRGSWPRTGRAHRGTRRASHPEAASVQSHFTSCRPEAAAFRRAPAGQLAARRATAPGACRSAAGLDRRWCRNARGREHPHLAGHGSISVSVRSLSSSRATWRRSTLSCKRSGCCRRTRQMAHHSTLFVREVELQGLAFDAATASARGRIPCFPGVRWGFANGRCFGQLAPPKLSVPTIRARCPASTPAITIANRPSLTSRSTRAVPSKTRLGCAGRAIGSQEQLQTSNATSSKRSACRAAGRSAQLRARAKKRAEERVDMHLGEPRMFDERKQ